VSTRDVVIVDGGGANIASLQFALERLGWRGHLTRDAEQIRSAARIILPGVGAARPAMERLEAAGLADVLRGLRQPLLGICLGMQLLFDASEEDATPCLGVIGGTVTRLPGGPDRPVPHMGWNRLSINRPSPLLEGVAEGTQCYFVHSYAAPQVPSAVATTDYGFRFCAAVTRDNFMGTQFHPERSGPAGSRILANFLAAS
jgi:glutamine amidotransferase